MLQRDRDVHRAGLFIPVQANTGSAATSYTDDQVVAGARYIYRIKAINAHGVSTWSAPARANTLAVPAPGSTPTPAPEPAPELVQDSSVPDQPTGLASEASHDSVSLTWDDPDDAGISHYQILRRDRDVHASGEFVTINSNTNSATTSYTDDSVGPEQRYVYRVQAVDQHGTSKWSSFARANTPAAPSPAGGTDADADADAPDAAVCSATGPCTGLDESPGVTHVPTLELTNVSHDSVTLEWTAPAGAPPLGYVILRTEDGAAPTLSSIIVGNTESQQTSYTDSGLEPRTLYTYWVSVLRDTGVSAFKHAPSASVTTAAAPDSVTEPAPAVVPYAGSPLAPSGLSAVLVTDGAVPPTLGGVQLDWDAPAEDAGSVTGYQIRRGPVGDQHTVVLVDDTATADTAYLDASATDQSYYFYEVVALRGAEPSDPSETVYVSLPTVIPPPPLETAPAQGHVSCSSDPAVPGLEIEHRLRYVRHINGGKPFVDARVVLTDADGADTWNLSGNVRFLRIGHNWDSNQWHSGYPVFWRTVEADEIGEWQVLRQVPYGDEVELFAYVVRDSDSTIVPNHTDAKALSKCFTVRRSDTIGDPQPPQPAAGAAFDDSTVVYFAGPTVEVDVSGWFTDPQGLSMNYYLCDQCDFYSWRSGTSDNGRDYYLFPTGKPLAWSWISGSTLHIRPTNNLSMFGRSGGGLWGPTDHGNIYNKGKGFVTVAAINSAGGVGVLDICFTLEYDAAEANRSTVKWAVNKRWPQTGTLTPCSTTFLKVAEGIALGQQP